jgi:hypothetical protein
MVMAQNQVARVRVTHRLTHQVASQAQLALAPRVAQQAKAAQHQVEVTPATIIVMAARDRIQKKSQLMTQKGTLTLIINTTPEKKVEQVEQLLQLVYEILDTHGQWCLVVWLCLQQVSL